MNSPSWNHCRAGNAVAAWLERRARNCAVSGSALAIGLLGMQPLQSAAAAQSIHLARAIELGTARPAEQALQLQAQADDALATAATRQAYWPRLSVSGGIAHHSELASFATAAGSIRPGEQEQRFAEAALRQPLLDWSAMRYAAPAQRLMAETSALKADRGAAENGFAAASVYLNVLAVQARQQAETDLEKSLNEQLAQGDALFHQGRILEADLLRTKVARDEASQQIVSLEQEAQLGMQELARAIGSDEAVTPEPVAVQALHLSLPEGALDLQAVAGRRQDVAALEREIHALDLKAKAVSAELVPKVEALASYADRSGVPLYPDHDLMVGVQMTWSLFDAGTLGPRASALRLEKQALEQQLSERRRQVAVELQHARSSFVTAKSLGELAESALVSARKTLDTRSALYQYGRVNIDEVLAAQADLANQTALHDVAALDLIRAWLECRLAMGIDLNDPVLGL